MIESRFAAEFAREWIEAWNDHDTQRIPWHYAEDFPMSSRCIARLAGVASGSWIGKPAVRAQRASSLTAGARGGHRLPGRLVPRFEAGGWAPAMRA